jgi:hypothetical protein
MNFFHSDLDYSMGSRRELVGFGLSYDSAMVALLNVILSSSRIIDLNLFQITNHHPKYWIVLYLQIL